MPSEISLTKDQINEIRNAIKVNIDSIDPSSICGTASLNLFCSTKNGQKAVLKLFHPSNQLNIPALAVPEPYHCELEALKALKNAQYSPRLLEHGELKTRIKIKHFTLQYWLIRTYGEGDLISSKNGIDTAQTVLIKTQLKQFFTTCCEAEIVVGDLKLDNFVWDGASITWVDFGMFKKCTQKTYRGKQNLRAFLKMKGFLPR